MARRLPNIEAINAIATPPTRDMCSPLMASKWAMPADLKEPVVWSLRSDRSPVSKATGSPASDSVSDSDNRSTTNHLTRSNGRSSRFSLGCRNRIQRGGLVSQTSVADRHNASSPTTQ